MGMMKQIINKIVIGMILLSSFSVAEEAAFSTLLKEYQNGIWLSFVLGFVFIWLPYLVIKYRANIKIKDILIHEKDEKIKYLRLIIAENEHKSTEKEHDTEKKLIEFQYQIEKLELKLKEGTKNQVVSKIETQQSIRAKELKRAGLKH